MGDQHIEKFDPATLMDGVRNRIKATFISLIPDDQWGAMVKKEVDAFFQQKDTWNNSSRSYVSDFQTLVKQTLDAEAKRRVAEYFASPEFEVTWDTNGRPIVNEQIKKLLIENSGEILANMMGSMFASMLSNFRSSLQVR